MRKSKRDWFLEGLNVLANAGATALTIEELAARLGVTKGSFYHHFHNIQDFKQGFLDFCESESTLQIFLSVEAEQTPQAKIDRLLDIVATEDTRLEVALRAWALQDELARTYQQRIDTLRIAYLRQLCQAVVSDDATAETMAEMLYTIYVGSQQVVPPIRGDGLKRVYTMFKRFYID
jgi:AcrR family transcriptional regulator